MDYDIQIEETKDFNSQEELAKIYEDYEWFLTEEELEYLYSKETLEKSVS